MDENNMNKLGHPFKIPKALTTLLARLRSMYGILFMSLEGISRLVSRITGILTVCYTSIFREIIPELDHHDGKPLGCAIDSTGFKITIRGDYLGSKWHRKRKGWSKLYAVIPIHDVSVLSFAITDELVDDGGAGSNLLASIRNRILGIFGDKGYDSKSTYNMF